MKSLSISSLGCVSEAEKGDILSDYETSFSKGRSLDELGYEADGAECCSTTVKSDICSSAYELIYFHRLLQVRRCFKFDLL